MPKSNPTDETHISNICRIAQGLLASGHYTQTLNLKEHGIDRAPINEMIPNDIPFLKSVDTGEDRNPYIVVGHAFAIYAAINLKWQERKREATA